MEGNNDAALAQHIGKWANLLKVWISPVIEDVEAASALSKLYEKQSDLETVVWSGGCRDAEDVLRGVDYRSGGCFSPSGPHGTDFQTIIVGVVGCGDSIRNECDSSRVLVLESIYSARSGGSWNQSATAVRIRSSIHPLD